MLRVTMMVFATAAALGCGLADAIAIGGGGFGIGHMGRGSGEQMGILSGRMEGGLERRPALHGGDRDQEFQPGYCYAWGEDGDRSDDCR